jgi:hypothetical protein
MRFFQSMLLVSGTIAAAMLPMFHSAAQAGTRACYEVRDRDGWSYVRSFSTRKVMGRLGNGTTFVSDYTTPDNFAVVGGLGEPAMVIALSRLQVVSDARCNRSYGSVSDREGSANLRSAPNGEVTAQVRDEETILLLRTSQDGQWVNVLTPNGKIGWMHRSRIITN